MTNTGSVSPGHKHAIADITDAGSFITTGLILPYAGSGAPTGFLLCDGSAVSRTTYAALFALVSTSYGIGDGSTTFNVPDIRGRSIIGVGTGTKVLTFASRSSNTITVTGSANASTNEVQTGQAVLYHSTGGVITGLTDNTTYYMIRSAYNQFTLASSLANAQIGTPITLSSDGSGVQTFTYTLTARALADTGGEETHAMSSLDILAHTHDSATQSTSGGAVVTGIQARTASNQGSTSTSTSNPYGGNVAMNNMGSFLTLTYIIKT